LGPAEGEDSQAVPQTTANLPREKTPAKAKKPESPSKERNATNENKKQKQHASPR
jgi:hypothetical protein